MKPKTFCALAIAGMVAPFALGVHALVSKQTFDAISTPDRVNTRIGTLDFK